MRIINGRTIERQRQIYFIKIISFFAVLITATVSRNLYFSSLTIGITIAILNFSLPVWVKENVSGHSGLITGIYITLMGGFANIAILI